MARLIPETYLAAITIWQEARGEPQAGRVAVAEVIRNRMQRRYASDGSVAGTVLRPLQFSGWNSRDPNRIPSLQLDDKDPIVRRCIEAWLAAMAGSNEAQGAVLYYAPAIITVPPDWAKPAYSERVAIVGAHHFFLPHSLRGSA